MKDGKTHMYYQHKNNFVFPELIHVGENMYMYFGESKKGVG